MQVAKTKPQPLLTIAASCLGNLNIQANPRRGAASAAATTNTTTTSTTTNTSTNASPSQSPPTVAQAKPSLSSSSPLARSNELNLQMLSRPLHETVFGTQTPQVTWLAEARAHLKQHGLADKVADVMPEIDWELPPLQGDTIEEHFRKVGAETAAPYQQYAIDYASAAYQPSPTVDAWRAWPQEVQEPDAVIAPFENDNNHQPSRMPRLPFARHVPGSSTDDMVPIEQAIPPMPTRWSRAAGWTRIGRDGVVTQVPYPDLSETALTFDIENCVQAGPYPIMAAAVSVNAWYTWVSPQFLPWLDGTANSTTPNPKILIPFGNVRNVVRPDDRDASSSAAPTEGSNNPRQIDLNSVETVTGPPRLVVGHRVSYDRARILDEYFIRDSGLRFVDTASLHMCVTGERRERANSPFPKRTTLPTNDLADSGSLKDLCQFYLGEEVSKDARDIFVNGSLQDVADNFELLMAYCANDVRSTYRLYAKLLPAYMHKCPNPVSFAGMLEMGSCYLPIDATWYNFIAQGQAMYSESSGLVNLSLQQMATEALALAQVDPATGRPKYESDPWLRNLDWHAEPQRMTKEKRNKKGEITEPSRPVSKQRLAGMPEWYKALCPTGSDRPEKLTSRTMVTPYLLRLAWLGHPVRFIKGEGWGFVLPANQPRPPGVSTLMRRFFQLDSSSPTEKEEEEAAAEEEAAVAEDDEFAEQLEVLAGADANKDDADMIDNVSTTITTTTMDNIDHVNNTPNTTTRSTTKTKTKPATTAAAAAAAKKDRSHLEPVLFNDKTVPITVLHGQEPDWLVFYRIPHKGGETVRCGSPLAKDYLKALEKGVLTSQSETASKALALNTMCAYWVGVNRRVKSQFSILQDMLAASGNAFPVDPSTVPSDCLLPPSTISMGTEPRPPSSHGQDQASQLRQDFGAIVPQVVSAGTITRRAVEPTWMTASNAKKNRLGSELKIKVVAPQGYQLVGADVDSEELWIAALFGDARFGLHGATALGWMTLAGKKSDGTDMHSKTAATLKTDRDHAKIFNYARIYGAGMSYAQKLLKQFDASLSQEEADKRSSDLYASTKGRRDGQSRSPSQPTGEWRGGSESYTFNKLEQIATKNPRTPALGCEICNALHPNVIKGEFATTRVNWAVQSSGVDYLHLLLTSVKWLVQRYKIDARLCITIHDEVRFLVRETDTLRLALAMQVANLWTRALFSAQVGVYDLPLSVAFFSGVDVDHVLRKESNQICVTPSQPVPLALGRTLDIQQLLSETDNGSWLIHPPPTPTDAAAQLASTSVRGLTPARTLRPAPPNAHFKPEVKKTSAKALKAAKALPTTMTVEVDAIDEPLDDEDAEDFIMEQGLSAEALRQRVDKALVALSGSQDTVAEDTVVDFDEALEDVGAAILSATETPTHNQFAYRPNWLKSRVQEKGAVRSAASEVKGRSTAAAATKSTAPGASTSAAQAAAVAPPLSTAAKRTRQKTVVVQVPHPDSKSAFVVKKPVARKPRAKTADATAAEKPSKKVKDEADATLTKKSRTKLPQEASPTVEPEAAAKVDAPKAAAKSKRSKSASESTSSESVPKPKSSTPKTAAKSKGSKSESASESATKPKASRARTTK
ncbi:DNA polymerase gamma [Capsaspora owczarzaki ATCC 30864]|uniref:DNA-directed DNA polymerase n=2 Tax=Capsaspora owczarzaki (strain ATCC 30864) TaxID=595528 RepID=A0A0D2WHZ0_CAPO3|nr:DNA polymerase gamma [Capsaspora owczarzaki ATCC 30864]